MSDTKVCTRCGIEYPFSKFNRDKSRPDGYTYICVYCRSPRRAENEKRRRDYLLPYRICTGCGKSLDKSFFGNAKDSPDGKKAKCKKCYAEQMRKARADNPERAKEISKKCAKGRTEKIKAYAQEYYEKNKQTLSRNHKEWCSHNKEKIRSLGRSRRARQMNAPGGGVTKEQWESIVNFFGGKCLYPGCDETHVTMDHIVPLFCGGAHDTYNVQPLCRKHNSQKKIKTADYRCIADWT